MFNTTYKLFLSSVRQSPLSVTRIHWGYDQIYLTRIESRFYSGFSSEAIIGIYHSVRKDSNVAFMLFAEMTIVIYARGRIFRRIEIFVNFETRASCVQLERRPEGKMIVSVNVHTFILHWGKHLTVIILLLNSEKSYLYYPQSFAW